MISERISDDIPPHNYKQQRWFHTLLYQSLPMLTELFQHDLINVFYLTACYLYQVMMTLHFLNDVAYDAESTQTSKLRHNR